MILTFEQWMLVLKLRIFARVIIMAIKSAKYHPRKKLSNFLKTRAATQCTNFPHPQINNSDLNLENS